MKAETLLEILPALHPIYSGLLKNTYVCEFILKEFHFQQKDKCIELQFVNSPFVEKVSNILQTH